MFVVFCSSVCSVDKYHRGWDRYEFLVNLFNHERYYNKNTCYLSFEQHSSHTQPTDYIRSGVAFANHLKSKFQKYMVAFT